MLGDEMVTVRRLPGVTSKKTEEADSSREDIECNPGTGEDVEVKEETGGLSSHGKLMAIPSHKPARNPIPATSPLARHNLDPSRASNEGFCTWLETQLRTPAFSAGAPPFNPLKRSHSMISSPELIPNPLKRSRSMMSSPERIPNPLKRMRFTVASSEPTHISAVSYIPEEINFPPQVRDGAIGLQTAPPNRNSMFLLDRPHLGSSVGNQQAIPPHGGSYDSDEIKSITPFFHPATFRHIPDDYYTLLSQQNGDSDNAVASNLAPPSHNPDPQMDMPPFDG